MGCVVKNYFSVKIRFSGRPPSSKPHLELIGEVISFALRLIMIYPTRGKNFSYAHITGRTLLKVWPGLPLDLVWEIFCQHLEIFAKPGGAQVNAFVLMSNHFHLLITEEITKMAGSCEGLARKVEESFNRHSGETGPVFDTIPGYSLISDFKHLRQVYHYIYQNPVRAGLVIKAENYKYSTLGPLLGLKNNLCSLPVMDTFGIIYDPIRLLRWINNINESEQLWYGL